MAIDETIIRPGVFPNETGITDDSIFQPADADLTTIAAAGNGSVLAATTASFTTADETKLDGVETGADVTDTANVTSAGALMDSEVTNLAAVKAFDTADYATAAQGTTADSAVQPGDNVSGLANDAGYTTTAAVAAGYQPLDTDLTTIAASNNGSVLAATTASFTTADETNLDFLSAKIVYLENESTINADGSTDDKAALQTIIDANQTAIIDFGSSSYVLSGEVILVDDTGRNFQGYLIGNKATITFSHSGATTDEDRDMARGFSVYTTSAGSSGSISGWSNLNKMSGLDITGPLNGCSFFLANSQGPTVENNFFRANRYGVACENCISAKIDNNKFYNFVNGGVAFINTSDPARVSYEANPAVPRYRYWNDLHEVTNNGFLVDPSGSGGTNGALACILDMGSTSENMRVITGNYCYVASSAVVQYGYLGRAVNPIIENNFFENMKYPVRFLGSNSKEGTSATVVTGVTAAQGGYHFPEQTLLSNEGNWDASAGTFPGGGNVTQGDYWTVTTGGTVDSIAFVTGDRIIALQDDTSDANSSTTTYASNWSQNKKWATAGAYEVGTLPDGYGFSTRINANWFEQNTDCINVTGLRESHASEGINSVEIGGNYFQGTTSFFLVSNEVSPYQHILDKGNTGSYTGGAYSYLADQAVLFSTGDFVSDWTQTSGTPSSEGGAFGAAAYFFRYKRVGKTLWYELQVNITTNGPGSGYVIVGTPFDTENSAIYGSTAGLRLSDKKAICGLVHNNQITIYLYDGTYPASNGETLILNGVYEID
jgi:hypothetical protein